MSLSHECFIKIKSRKNNNYPMQECCIQLSCFMNLTKQGEMIADNLVNFNSSPA